MTVYVLMVWLAGAGAPMVFDAYKTLDACQAVAVVHSAKPNRIAVCPMIRVVSGSLAEAEG
jgi:hypothetical protein